MKARNKILSLAMAFLLLAGNFSLSATAADVKQIAAQEIDGVYNMKVDSNSWTGWEQGPHIYSEAGIVMDMDSGAILYAKNIDAQHYPASITKVMTALVALQNYELDETVKFTWEDIGFLEYGDAHIGIKEDEELSMEDALYGMLLASANEVSHAIGSHMEGGYDAFLEKMNETAKEIGCTNSHWMNTHGLHDEEHYTTVRDMAIIGSAAFQYEKFREITGTYQHTIPETKITAEKRYVHQNHKMIRDWDDRYYEYCVGGKTGYTDQALTTLITFATKGDMNLVAVVMRTHGGGNNAYADTREILEYGFNNFTKVPVTKDITGNENIASLNKDAYIIMPNSLSSEKDIKTVLVEPTKEGDKTAKMEFYYGELLVGKADGTITEERYNEIHKISVSNNQKKPEKKGTPKVLSVVLKIVLGVVITTAVLFGALIVYVYFKRKEIEKNRRMRRMQQMKQRELE